MAVYVACDTVPACSLAPLLTCSLAPLLACSRAHVLPCSRAHVLPCPGVRLRRLGGARTREGDERGQDGGQVPAGGQAVFGQGRRHHPLHVQRDRRQEEVRAFYCPIENPTSTAPRRSESMAALLYHWLVAPSSPRAAARRVVGVSMYTTSPGEQGPPTKVCTAWVRVFFCVLRSAVSKRTWCVLNSLIKPYSVASRPHLPAHRVVKLI